MTRIENLSKKVLFILLHPFLIFVIQNDKRTKVYQLNFLKFFVVLTFQEGLSSIV